MTFIAANWKGILLGLVTALTLIQEILSLMGHGSGALTSVISFLNQLSQSPAATAVPSQPPPSVPAPAAVAASPTNISKT